MALVQFGGPLAPFGELDECNFHEMCWCFFPESRLSMHMIVDVPVDESISYLSIIPYGELFLLDI